VSHFLAAKIGVSDRAPGLRLTGRRGAEPPAWLATPLGCPQRVRARALRHRRHGWWRRRRPGGLGVAPGRWNAGDPWAWRLGKVLEVLGALAGTSGPQGRGPAGGGPGRHGLLDEGAARRPIAAVAPARLQQERPPRLGLAHHLPPALMQGGPGGSPRAPGARHDLCVRGLVAVGASGARATGRGERRQGGNAAPTLGGTHGQQAVECGHPRGRERIPGTSQSLVREWSRGHTGRKESRRRRMVAAAGDERARRSPRSRGCGR
jgi:hypothetical protein